jgi:hypothetical protein
MPVVKSVAGCFQAASPIPRAGSHASCSPEIENLPRRNTFRLGAIGRDRRREWRRTFRSGARRSRPEKQSRTPAHGTGLARRRRIYVVYLPYVFRSTPKCLIRWRPQGDSNPCYRRERAGGMADFRDFCNFMEHRDRAASRVALLTNGMVATTSIGVRPVSPGPTMDRYEPAHPGRRCPAPFRRTRRAGRADRCS